MPCCLDKISTSKFPLVGVGKILISSLLQLFAVFCPKGLSVKGCSTPLVIIAFGVVNVSITAASPTLHSN
jgi:hypothetical protein